MTSAPIAGFDAFTELQFAIQLADLADTLTLPHYTNRSFSLDWKANRTEVTEADRETESAIAAEVLARAIPHAGLTYGYRITCGGVVVAYLPDHQQPVDGSMGVVDAVLELAEGADLLIHDGLYTEADYQANRNTGHSSFAATIAVEPPTVGIGSAGLGDLLAEESDSDSPEVTAP